MQFSINAGSFFNAGPVTTTDCTYSFVISGLEIGDTIVFNNSSTFTVAGSTSVCPDGPGGFGCNFSYSVVSSGPQNVYITVDGSTAC